MNKYITILRLSHWSKNIFVFAALLFGKKLIGTSHEVVLAIASAAGAFLCFSLASSAMYILNDIFDRQSDRNHPEKSQRPIASGEVGITEALILAGICGAAGMIGSTMIARQFTLILAIYLAITTLYSIWLKRVMIVDVIIIAIGFVLRAVAGAVVVGVYISPWLIICTFALCLFMGLGKRYGEVKLLEHNGSSFRKTLGGYTPELLSHMLNVTSALTIVCFLLYSMDARTKLTFGTDNLVFTVPLVLYCIFRFSVLIQKGTYSGPVTVLIHDRPFQIGLALWAAACMGIIYANRLGISLSDIVTY